MSFQELVDAENALKDRTSESSALGSFELKARTNNHLKNVQVKYFVANMEMPGDAEEVERIFTQSLQCQNMLVKSGDISVFKEESHFTKTGEYLIAIKYAEYVEEKKE